MVGNGSAATLADVIDRTRVQTVITVGPDDIGGEAVRASGLCTFPLETVTLTTAITEGGRLSHEPVALDGSDLLLVQYTGGTTGLSKGAALSHRNLVANIEQFRAFTPNVQRPGEEVVVTAIPLYLIFAFMADFLSYFAIGAENWLIANPKQIDDFFDVLNLAPPTVFFGVNTRYAGLASHPRLREVDWSHLKLSAGGGSAIIDVVSARWKAVTGNFISEGFGLSETSPLVTFNPQFIDDFTGTAGLPRSVHRSHAARRQRV
ncbi:acyl-CoA synthetase (AMP-forming)/AMP-acid ligase II [Paraburkholderia youngii]